MEMCGAVQWGDVPGWIEAIATVVAALAAIVAAILARRALRAERQRDFARALERDAELRALEERERRAQADLVSCWIIDSPSAPFQPRRIQVRNASTLPIREVAVWARRDGALADKTFAVVPPSDKDRWFLLPKDPAWHSDPEVECIMRFTDAAGVRWLRDQSGRLHESASDMEGIDLSQIEPPERKTPTIPS